MARNATTATGNPKLDEFQQRQEKFNKELKFKHDYFDYLIVDILKSIYRFRLIKNGAFNGAFFDLINFLAFFSHCSIMGHNNNGFALIIQLLR